MFMETYIFGLNEHVVFANILSFAFNLCKKKNLIFRPYKYTIF